MTSTLTFRKARAADVRTLAEMARDVIEVGLRWTWRPARLTAAIRDRDGLAVVALDGDVILGFCLVKYGLESAHVVLLAVSPSAQRNGVGARLLNWHLKCARTAGLQRVTLELRASFVGSQRFYEALGFSCVGRSRGYYQGTEDALKMVMELAQ